MASSTKPERGFFSHLISSKGVFEISRARLRVRLRAYTRNNAISRVLWFIFQYRAHTCAPQSRLHQSSRKAPCTFDANLDARSLAHSIKAHTSSKQEQNTRRPCVYLAGSLATLWSEPLIIWPSTWRKGAFLFTSSVLETLLSDNGAENSHFRSCIFTQHTHSLRRPHNNARRALCNRMSCCKKF